MTYRDTARRYVAADYGLPTPDTARKASDKLPMSDWAESRRDTMTPQTIAANHALHVESAAAELRAQIAQPLQFDILRGVGIERAARALLAAIGEGE